MSSVQPDLHELARWYEEQFPPAVDVRTIGREAEFPVVHADGTAADVEQLWPAVFDAARKVCDAQAITEERDGISTLTGVSTEHWIATSEAGRGTIEVSVGPGQRISDLELHLEQAMRTIARAATSQGLHILCYGIQPVTPASRALLTPRPRYLLLMDALEPADATCWAITAGDQTHVALARHELSTAVTTLHAASPFFVALTANSNVWSGRLHEQASGRQYLMDRCTVEPYRHGVPPVHLDSVDKYVAHLAQFEMLFERAEDGQMQPGRRLALGKYIEEAGSLSEPARVAFADQEHYVWPAARLRPRWATVEHRPACQPPWAATWVPTALTLGLVQAAPELERWLREFFADDWENVVAQRNQAIDEGLQWAINRREAVEAVLDMARDGLKRRGFGEEHYLDPLIGWLDSGIGPAEQVAREWNAGGAEALVALTALNPETSFRNEID